MQIALLRFSTIALLMVLITGYALAAVAAPAPDPVSTAPRMPGPEIIDDISQASPDTLYLAIIAFEAPMTVDQLRAAADQLDIPRVFGRAVSTAVRSGRLAFAVTLGTLLPPDLQDQHNRCNAALSAARFRNVDASWFGDWIIREVHVDATAHQILEFISGSYLPPARVKGGFRQGDLEDLRRTVVKSMTEQKRRVDDVTRIPPACDGLIAVHDAPVIAGTDRALAGLALDAIRERLATLSQNDVVTLGFEFTDAKRTAKDASELVEKYRIEGMRADLQPVYSDRVIVLAEFSIHGEPPAQRLARTRCQMLGMDSYMKAAPNTDRSWYVKHLSATLRPTDALSLLNNEPLHQVRLQSIASLDKLDRVIAHHSRTQTGRRPFPGDTIPTGCENYFKASPATRTRRQLRAVPASP